MFPPTAATAAVAAVAAAAAAAATTAVPMSMTAPESLSRRASHAREQLHPRLPLNSLLFRRFPQKTGVSVGSGAKVVVNIHMVGGLKPGGNDGTDSSVSSISTQVPEPTYMPPTSGTTNSSPDLTRISMPLSTTE